MPNELEELQAWYKSHCDGDWEHTYGLKLFTLDNPGWAVEIELAATELSERPFSPIRNLSPQQEWIDCEVADGKFSGHGGPTMLGRILRAFLDWAQTANDGPVHNNGRR